MRRTEARRPSPALLIAVLALFVALGGSSYAAIALSPGSVKSRHIGKGQVKSADVAKGAINSAKVADGSLLAGDFKPGQLAAGAPGPAGPQGPVGPQGPKGDPGAPGLSGLERVTKFSATNSLATKEISVTCPDGKQVIDTAASIRTMAGAETTVALTDVYAFGKDQARAHASEMGGGTMTQGDVAVQATCATVG
jgi:hypothetical protein